MTLNLAFRLKNGKKLACQEFHSVEKKGLGNGQKFAIWGEGDSFHLFLQGAPAANQDSRCKMIPAAAFPGQKSVRGQSQ